MIREMIYPNYKAEVVDGGDIRLRFFTPGSKFGSVRVILAADDALLLLRDLDKALVASDDAAATERTQ